MSEPDGGRRESLGIGEDAGGFERRRTADRYRDGRDLMRPHPSRRLLAADLAPPTLRYRFHTVDHRTPWCSKNRRLRSSATSGTCGWITSMSGQLFPSMTTNEPSSSVWSTSQPTYGVSDPR